MYLVFFLELFSVKVIKNFIKFRGYGLIYSFVVVSINVGVKKNLKVKIGL